MSPPRTRRTREEQRAETRERLLEAAAEVFAARGVDGASIDEITERAGYTRGAFYSNFSGKAELLVELCEQRLRGYAAEIVPVIHAAPETERVQRAARLLTDRAPEPEVLLLVELARLRDGNAEVAALLDRFLEGFTDLIAEVLADSPHDLGDPTPTQRRDAARAIVGAVVGISFLKHLGFGGGPRTAELLLEGIGRAAFPDADLPAATHADGDDADASSGGAS